MGSEMCIRDSGQLLNRKRAFPLFHSPNCFCLLLMDVDPSYESSPRITENLPSANGLPLSYVSYPNSARRVPNLCRRIPLRCLRSFRETMGDRHNNRSTTSRACYETHRRNISLGLDSHTLLPVESTKPTRNDTRHRDYKTC